MSVLRLMPVVSLSLVLGLAGCQKMAEKAREEVEKKKDKMGAEQKTANQPRQAVAFYLEAARARKLTGKDGILQQLHPTPRKFVSYVYGAPKLSDDLTKVIDEKLGKDPKAPESTERWYDRRNNNEVDYCGRPFFIKDIEVLEEDKKDDDHVFLKCKVTQPKLVVKDNQYVDQGEETVTVYYQAIRVTNDSKDKNAKVALEKTWTLVPGMRNYNKDGKDIPMTAANADLAKWEELLKSVPAKELSNQKKEETLYRELIEAIKAGKYKSRQDAWDALEQQHKKVFPLQP